MKKVIFLIMVLFSLQVLAMDKVKDIVVQNPWARPSINNNSAVYMSIQNNDVKDDQLIKADCELAGKTEIHKTIEVQGIISMVPINNVGLPAGVKIELAPKALHIMLFDLKKELKENDTFPLTLTFQNSGEMTIQVKVKSFKN